MSDLNLELLGGFEARTADGESLSFPTKKTKALLAYLCAHPGKSHSRSEIAGLLWGNSAEEQARASLRQTLADLRKALAPTGCEHLVVKGDLVSINPTTVEVDVAVVEDLAARGNPDGLESVSSLYQGEFLNGFDLREEEFNDWLRAERARLHGSVTDALRMLLAHCEANDQVARGIRIANRLIEIDPLREHAHRSLIRLHLRQGERALAIKQFETCRQLLQRELGVEPDNETRRVWQEARAAKPNNGEGEHRTFSVGRGDPTRWRWGVIAATVLVLFAGAAVWWVLPQDSASDRGELHLPGRPSIAVLPFEDISDDPERSLFAKGLTNDIITDLSKFSTLFVIASDSSSRYRGGAVNVKEVARDLGVRFVLVGNVQSLDARLSIDANLIDATTGRHIWAEHYERPAENLFAIQKEITQTIAAVVGSGRGKLQVAEIERIRRIPTKDLQAYGFYVRGVEFSRRETREGNALAREMFEKAIQADPNYARAMAENSLTYLWDVFQGWADSREEWLQRAEDLARRAIAIDHFEPWSFVALGVFYQANARNEEAISSFETAHALNPNDYGVKRALGYAVTYAGSAERGIELLEKAQRLNPYHTDDPTLLVWAYFFAHRYQDALTTTNKITRRHTETYWIYKAAIHAQLDQTDEARAAVAEALKLNTKLTVQSEHELRLALGLAPTYAEHLTNALRKAGLPE
jgi:TolB-like protein/DNA-binding SARP family transcriptional activator/Flp pilus assembly protein TadD